MGRSVPGSSTWTAVLVGATTVVLGGAEAQAAPSADSVRLAWRRGLGAEACFEQAALAQAVRLRLGHDPFSSDAARTVEASVARDGARWTAHIELVDDGGRVLGSRELGSDALECGALEGAVTLAIALAIDPAAALRPPGEPPPSAPPSRPPAAPAAPTPPPPAPSAAPPAALPPPAPRSAPAGAAIATSLGARAVVGLGLLPAVAPGLALAADVRGSSRFYGSAGVLWLPERRTDDDEFGFGLTAGWLGGCVDAARSSRVTFGLCASALAGAIHAVTYVLEPAEPGERGWVAVSLASRLRVALGAPVVAEAGLEAAAPILRHDFQVVGRSGTVFQQTPVTGLGYLGLGVSFP